MSNTRQLNFVESVDVKNILTPLMPLGIIGFFFVRMYPDGSFVNLTSDAPWADFFFKKFYGEIYTPETLTAHMFTEHSVTLSELNPHNQNWQDGKEYFNVGNAIMLSQHYGKYCENYYFYAHKDNAGINEFYLGHIDLLYQFIDYFKKQASTLILQGEANKFYTPKKYLLHKSNQPLKNKECVSTQQLSRFFQNNNTSLISKEKNILILSKKEKTCLFYLVQGKSAEEIAIILSRSKRTVEGHIENIKQKLNCSKISQLAYMLGKMNTDIF